MQMIACGACSRALLAVSRTHVHRDRLDLRGALPDPRLGVVGLVRAFLGRVGRSGLLWIRRVELGEELVGGVFAGAFAAPHDLAATVVGDEREVAVLLSPGHLVNPDLEQPLQPLRVELVGSDALDDPPNGSPVDSEHPLDRRLVRLGREPLHELLEVTGEVRSWTGERHPLGPHPVHGANEPAERCADLEPPDAEIQVPPVGLDLADVVAMRGRVAALRADQPPAAQRDLDGHPASLAPDRPDPPPIELKKPGKCRGDAHVILPRKPLTFEQPAACPWGRRRVAHQRATSENFRRRGKRCSRTQTRLRVTYIDYRSPLYQPTTAL